MTKKTQQNDQWDNDNLDNDYGSGVHSRQDELLDELEEDDESIFEDLEEDEDSPSKFVEEPEADEAPVRIKSNGIKSKLIGKHSLPYDTIFKGKKNEPITEDSDSEYIIKNAGGSFDVSDETLEFEESRNSIDHYRDVRLKQEIASKLSEFTDINFTANRRKPAKTDFNAYYAMLLKELAHYGYSRTEIFIELAGYFSDNVWNMFQLLEKQYCNSIINELKEKYGLSDMGKIDFLG